MALTYAQINVVQIEIDLKDKPAEMRAASPKATVPVLLLAEGVVIDESMDIIFWALQQSDPDNWLCPQFKDSWSALIALNDSSFKPILNNYKYPERAEKKDQIYYRNSAKVYLEQLDTLLMTNRYLIAEHISIADVALFPFVRQFYMVDVDWFRQSGFRHLLKWLERIINSSLFETVMKKRDHPG